MTTRLVVGAVLACCWSCNTETIDEGVCGNGIIDRGEDCDAPGSRCQSCSITCETGETAECEAYDPDGGTVGFICGPDKLCHAPSGEFEQARFLSIPATAVQITDVDGDGRQDLLIPSQTQIATIRFPTEETSEPLAIPTPIARGNPTFGPLDQSGGNDTLLPTSDGIVAYTTTDLGQPTPFPFPSFVPSKGGIPQFLQPITTQHLSIIGIAPDQTLSYTALDIGQPQPTELGESTMCNGTVNDTGFNTFEDLIDVFEVASQHQLIAMWLRPFDAPARLCVMASDFNGTGYAIAQVAAVTAAEPTSRPILANLRGQECPSLVVAQGNQLVEYKAASATRPCSFQTAPTLLVGAPAGAAPVGTVALVPSIGGASAFALALSTGIYQVTGNTLDELYGSDRPIRRIRTQDMNGDGDLDVVATTFSSVGFGSDDLDVLDRRPAGFLRFRFDTETEVLTFQLGDFDGNEVPDVAYVDLGGDGARLQIAYGTSDQLLPGVTVGAFSQLLSMIPTQVFDSSDRIGAVTDLAVLFIDSSAGVPVDDMGRPMPTPSSAALSLLHGSPQRTMLAFFDPRPQFPPPTSESQFRGVITGRFSAGSTGNDVLAVEQEGPFATVYLSRGASGGELGIDISSDASNIKSCTTDGTSPNSDTFCVDDAQYLAWRDPSTSRDTVVAIDTEFKVIGFDPATMQQGQPIVLMPWKDTFTPLDQAVVRELQQLDLDGAAKLMIGLGTPADVFDTTTGGLFLCDFDPVTGPSGCIDVGARVTELRPSPDGSKFVCVDAGIGGIAPARRFEPPTGDARELVVLCTERFEIDGISFPGSTRVFRMPFDLSTAEVLIDGVFGDTLQVGDVSGDGIDDIVVHDSRSQFLTIYRQCTSRDRTCETVGDETSEPSMGGK